jgi:undecaprenyl-diphosphatase
MEWLESLVLGVVQGITEFLPVSSDGHLLLTQNLFGWLTGAPKTGKENLFFDVILHLGTTAAILVHYRKVIAHGLRGLMGGDDVEPGFRRPELIRVGVLAAVATSPLIPLALFLKKTIEKTFEGIAFAGAGFLITAVVLMLTAGMGSRDRRRRPGSMRF